MSRAAGDGQQVFVLRPEPPVRGLAICGAAMIVGAVVLVGSGELGWPAAISWLGLTIMIAAAVVGLAAVLSTRRLRSEVILRPAGVTVGTARGRATVAWSSVQKVSAVDGHLVLVPKTEGDPEIVLINPRRRPDATYVALVDAVRVAMDADRGYRNL